MKEVVRNPRRFIENAISAKVKTLSEKDPIARKLYRIKQLWFSTVIQLLFKLVKANVKASYSTHSQADFIKLVKRFAKDFMKFEELSPALLHAERICEIKCHMVIAESLIDDLAFDATRRPFVERFLHTAYPRVQQLKLLVEQDDDAFLERLATVRGQAPEGMLATGTEQAGV